MTKKTTNKMTNKIETTKKMAKKKINKMTTKIETTKKMTKKRQKNDKIHILHFPIFGCPRSF